MEIHKVDGKFASTMAQYIRENENFLLSCLMIFYRDAIKTLRESRIREETFAVDHFQIEIHNELGSIRTRNRIVAICIVCQNENTRQNRGWIVTVICNKIIYVSKLFAFNFKLQKIVRYECSLVESEHNFAKWKRKNKNVQIKKKNYNTLPHQSKFGQ